MRQIIVHPIFTLFCMFKHHLHHITHATILGQHYKKVVREETSGECRKIQNLYRTNVEYIPIAKYEQLVTFSKTIFEADMRMRA